MRSRGWLAALLFTLAPAVALGQTTVEYYHLDALGTVRSITNQSGILIEVRNYLPFGEEWNPSPPQDPRKFTGKERDPETGYDYFGARYYASHTGRFTTTDPAFTLAENLVDPQRWNRYVYVRNNPLRYVDPDGRDWLYQAVMWMTPMHRYAQQHDKPFLPAFFSGGFGEVPRALPVWWNTTRTDAAIAATIAGLMPGGPKGEEGGLRITEPYRRPSGATTAAQRAAVQGQPCVDCGAIAPRMVADHKLALVKEYYETGSINMTRMRDVRSVQPQCPTCSARQGAEMSRYSAAMRAELEK